MAKIITDRQNGLKRVQFETTGESLTEQSHKKTCDINHIVSKYKRTGQLFRSSETPKYGDFSTISSFQDIQNRVINANNDFMRLPADLRKKFGNNPANLIDFLNNADNESEAIELGLIPKPVTLDTPIPENGSESVSEPITETENPV